MDVNDLDKFQMFAGLVPVGPKEMVSRLNLKSLEIDLPTKIWSGRKLQHFTNLVFQNPKEQARFCRFNEARRKKVELYALKGWCDFC